MELHDLNYLAVLLGAIIIFMLGGLWYSPLLFAKPWMSLQGKTAEEIKADGGGTAALYVIAFICALVQSLFIALFFHIMRVGDVPSGIHIAAMLWVGFTAPAMLVNALFSFRPWKLWLIDAGYFLAAYVLAGAMHGAWH